MKCKPTQALPNMKCTCTAVPCREEADVFESDTVYLILKTECMNAAILGNNTPVDAQIDVRPLYNEVLPFGSLLRKCYTSG